MRVITQKYPDGIYVTAPYNAEFDRAVKALGAQWLPIDREYAVPAEVEQELRQLLLNFFGEDYATPVERVNVEVTLNKAYAREVYLFGRRIAHRPDRKRRVQVGLEVTVLDGGFPATAENSDAVLPAAYGPVRLRIEDIPANHKDFKKFVGGAYAAYDGLVDWSDLLTEPAPAY